MRRKRPLTETSRNTPLADCRRVVLSSEAQGHAELWRSLNPRTELPSIGIFDTSNRPTESERPDSSFVDQVLGIVVIEALTNQATAQKRIQELEAEVNRLRTENTLRAFRIIAPAPAVKN